MTDIDKTPMTPDMIPIAIKGTLGDLAEAFKEVNFIAEDLDELKNQLTIEQITTAVDQIETMRKVLAVVSRDLLLAGTALIPKDQKKLDWTAQDGQTYTTELKWRSVRTAVQKDDLLGAVKQTARTVDKATGEVVNDADQLVTTLLKAYRLEPRWTEIKGLGIDPDEFCEVRYEPSIITTKTGDNP